MAGSTTEIPGAAEGGAPFHVKGVLYLGTQAFFEANVRGGVEALKAEIDDPALAAFISQRFLPATWYDVLPVPALIRAEARALRMSEAQYLLHRVRYQAKRDLGGVYAWVLRLASPAMVASRLPRIFAQMFDFATVEPGPSTQSSYEVTIGGYPTVLEDWLTTSFTVYAETALKLAGGASPKFEHSSAWAGERAGYPLRSLRCRLSWG